LQNAPFWVDVKVSQFSWQGFGTDNVNFGIFGLDFFTMT
jgi:hypothetical protein